MSYWVGIGISKQFDKYLNGSYILRDDSSYFIRSKATTAITKNPKNPA